jgi:VIT1/CCC1 family predicted Fe2+/Mn2+ transporter
MALIRGNPGSVGGPERHRGERSGLLRAAVLGADDGIVSVASLMVGVIAAGATQGTVLTAAAAGLVAGAMSMAAGEYVSVSSQRDTERADVAQEEREHAADPDGEHQELAAIYRRRGLPPGLALEVADSLTANDALRAHTRDELHLHPALMAQPVQAALSSGIAFLAGAGLPILASLVAPRGARTAAVVTSALVALVLLGIAGARAGGAPLLRGGIRVGIGGSLAIAVTAGVGHLVGHGGL